MLWSEELLSWKPPIPPTAPAPPSPKPPRPKTLKAFTVEQLLARGIENDEEADLLTKRRQALWTERSRLKADDEERRARIEEDLKRINTRLKQWTNPEDDEAETITKQRQALWTQRSRLKDKPDAQERLAEIEASIQRINARLRELRRPG